MGDRTVGVDSDPGLRAGKLGGSGLGPRRVVRTSMAISAALHLVALGLYAGFGRTLRPQDAAFPAPAFSGRAEGLRVVRVVEVETPDATVPDAPEELDQALDPGVEPDPPVLDAPPGPPGFVEPPLSPAERLRPRLRNRRLWAPLAPERHALTPEQRAELELAGLLEAWNDSVAVAERAAAAATDWTVRDGDGRRWGISPGQLHLGDVTLPLPDLQWLGGLREETALRVWEWEEIQRQSGQAVVRESWKERAEAIRARRDAQRRAQQPDTTRGR